jgi:uncharacterized protein YdaU (DUF1376 family)
MYWYKRNISDFWYTTRCLKPDEQLCYLHLIDHYHETEKPIPLNVVEVARRLGIDEIDMINRILQDFFVEEPDGWHRQDCDQGIAAYRKQSVGGKAGAEKRWGPNRVGNGVAMPTPSVSQAKANANQNQNHNKEPRVIATDSAPSERRDEGDSSLTTEQKLARIAEFKKNFGKSPGAIAN